VLGTICEQFGCAGRGIDVDRRRIEKARARSKRVTFECGLFAPAKHLGSYDILLSIAAVEHVPDPLDFLKQLNLALMKWNSPEARFNSVSGLLRAPPGPIRTRH
jgi:2-polyprenyl-3-methyl-5-hydroxy-6-metoxy-1,4-benzoquinol methylase